MPVGTHYCYKEVSECNHCVIDISFNNSGVPFVGKLSYEDTSSIQFDQNWDGSTKPRSIMTLHDLQSFAF